MTNDENSRVDFDTGVSGLNERLPRHKGIPRLYNRSMLNVRQWVFLV